MEAIKQDPDDHKLSASIGKWDVDSRSAVFDVDRKPMDDVTPGILDTFYDYLPRIPYFTQSKEKPIEEDFESVKSDEDSEDDSDFESVKWSDDSDPKVEIKK